MLGLFFLVYASGAVAKPIAQAIHNARSDVHGLEVVRLGFNIKIAETVLAIFSVSLVILTYALLIQRGSFMSTTAMYPQYSIERNIGSLLSLAWPKSSDEALGGEQPSSQTKTPALSSHETPSKASSIKLFYLGRMDTDNHSGLVAKGQSDCAAKPNRPDGNAYRPRIWMASGSHLTKNVVQLLVWEWVSLWLIGIMLFTTLLYNGFFTNNLSIDSYPRLVVALIYALAYGFHFWYVWTTCTRFFTSVAAGASWSLLERSKFAICDSKGLAQHRKGSAFNFRGIDKASSEYIPLTFGALFKHEVSPAGNSTDKKASLSPPPPVSASSSSTLIPQLKDQPTTTTTTAPEKDDLKETSAAIATLEVAQKAERVTATDSATTALDRVIANAMVMMGVTLASGFSSWTAAPQATTDTPNNFATTQIGSLALLASLSLGASTMFTSAMHLTILCSSYETILSLKEIKINGQAVDHYKKRQSSDPSLSFSQGTVPTSRVGFLEFLSTNRWEDLPSLLFFGPVFTLLPQRADHERTSRETDFDLCARVGSGAGFGKGGGGGGVGDGSNGGGARTVLFTTRQTDKHAKGKDGKNLETVNVCCIDAADADDENDDEKVDEQIKKVKFTVDRKPIDEEKGLKQV